MLGCRGECAHGSIDLGLRLSQIVAAIGFGDCLLLVNPGTRRGAAGQRAEIGRVYVRVFHRIRDHRSRQLALPLGILLGSLGGLFGGFGVQIIRQTSGSLLLDAPNHFVQCFDCTRMLVRGAHIVHCIGQINHRLG